MTLIVDYGHIANTEFCDSVRTRIMVTSLSLQTRIEARKGPQRNKSATLYFLSERRDLHRSRYGNGGRIASEGAVAQR
jgi:hypothetical protein